MNLETAFRAVDLDWLETDNLGWLEKVDLGLSGAETLFRGARNREDVKRGLVLVES